MVVSLKANRKRILAVLILAVAVVGAVLFLRMDKKAKVEERSYPGGTNEERIAFLQSFGWQVGSEPAETREVMIPAKFNDVYTTYNVMQKAQGFDLRPYAGEVCTQYKYQIGNYPNGNEVYATLLVYGDLIIGGDVACAEVDGFMHGFAPDSARYGETAEKTSPKKETVKKSGKAEPEAEESSQPESIDQGEGEAASEAVEGSVTETEAVESTAGEITEDDYPTD